MTGNTPTDRIIPHAAIKFINRSILRYERALRSRAKWANGWTSQRGHTYQPRPWMAAKPLPSHIRDNYAIARQMMQQLGISNVPR